ncbi:hypothetical protein GCM10023083_26320 [Streptomyces phyllanthi]
MNAFGPAPERYTWTLELDRHEKGLVMFFLYGDPDSRSAYVLEADRARWPVGPLAP